MHRQCGVDQHYRIEESPRSFGRIDGFCLVDTRYGHDIDFGGVLKSRDGPLQSGDTFAEIRTDRQDCLADRSHPARHRVSIELVRGWTLGHVLLRSIVTATSSNITVIGASGLCTVTLTHWTWE